MRRRTVWAGLAAVLIGVVALAVAIPIGAVGKAKALTTRALVKSESGGGRLGAETTVANPKTVKLTVKTSPRIGTEIDWSVSCTRGSTSKGKSGSISKVGNFTMPMPILLRGRNASCDYFFTGFNDAFDDPNATMSLKLSAR